MANIVFTFVLTTKASVEHSIEYCMGKDPSAGEWKINNVIIDGVSLAQIYRDQLDAIIAKSSYAGLLQELKSKILAVQ